MSGQYQEHRRSEPDADRSLQRIGTPGLAKVTPPRLRNVLARERLFRLLNDLLEHALIWVSAPAGSGKTTLIASWAQTLNANLVWYQCDEGDGDIASFFHFLSLAVPQANDSLTPLPRLTPELYASLTVFTRNYFREFFARLQRPAIVVLDNWQDVPDGAALRDCLPIILDETPRGVTLVAISREAPAANLSRALSTGQMTMVHWRELQLTEAETAGVAALYEPMPGQTTVPTARELYAVTHGWAAGVTVLLRHEAVVKPPDWSERNPSNQAVFDYLATEVFDRQESSIQQFMLKTACLETISVPVARELTANDQAEQILERFVQRNVFTVQQPASGTYQYHPLLKAFLKRRLECLYTRPQQLEQLQCAAKALAMHRQNEAAIPLWLAAKDWSNALREIVIVAPELSRCGRLKTLLDWIVALPERERADNAQAEFWLGVCEMALGSPTAISRLKSAYELFIVEQDLLGQMSAATEIVRHYQIGMHDFAASLPWLDALGRLLERRPAFPSKEIELTVVAGFIGTLALARIDSPDIRRYSERARQLLDEVSDIQCKAYATASLLSQQIHAGNSFKCRSLTPLVESLLARQDLAPTVLAQILLADALYHHIIGERARCAALLQRALIHMQDYGVSHFVRRILLVQLHTSNFMDDRVAVAAQLQQLESMLVDASPDLMVHLVYAQQLFYLAQGDFERALFYGRQVQGLSRTLHFPLATLLGALSMAETYCECGRLAEAAEQIMEARRMLLHADCPKFEFHVALVAAEVARQRSQVDACICELRHAFALGSLHKYVAVEHGYPLLFMKLVPVALEHGIEVEYCHYLIKKRNLSPPSYDIEHWPWPVKIHTLGGFAVVIEDERLEFAGKAQHKPLSLLKALLLDRAGISNAALLEYLWPDLDGDAARNALDLALHRLRRLLKRKDAVLYQDGRLMLDRTQVWVDAWALQTLCEQTPSQSDALAQMQKLLHLYRGHFLAGEEQEWIFAVRDRLRSQFVRRLSALAMLVEVQDHGEELIALLSKAIETDPLNEPFHRALIRCYCAQGRHTESVAAYQRCRELFVRLCGTEPSAQTRSLVQDLARFPEPESHPKDIRC